MLFKQWVLPGKKRKKEGIKLDFHNIGNMENSKPKLQKNATFSGSMERALCKSVFAKECNFFRQHEKSSMQVQIREIIRKSAEKYREQSSTDSDMKNAVGWPGTARVAIMQSNPYTYLTGATGGKLCEDGRFSFAYDITHYRRSACNEFIFFMNNSGEGLIRKYYDAFLTLLDSVLSCNIIINSHADRIMDKDKQSIELLLRTPQEVMLDCAARVRAMRIEQNLSQIALAERVGVAVGTIKRFEKTGEIQFHHLLSIALVLGRLEEFDRLFAVSQKLQSLFNLEEPKIRQRPRRK